MLCAPVNASSFPFGRSWLFWALLILATQGLIFADQSVTLTWSPSTDPNVAGYKIYYGGASGVYTNTVSVGNATNVTVSSLADGATYYFSATTVDSSGAESAFSNEAIYVMPLADTNSPTTTNDPVDSSVAPALDPITNVSLYQNAGVQTVNLTGISSGYTGGFQSINIWAYSSDPTILPDPTVTYTSPNGTGTLTFAPITNAIGTATVEVKVNNGSANFSRTFTVTVSPAPVVAQPPTLDALTNLTIYQGGGPEIVNLTGITPGSGDPNALVVSAASSDTNIVTAPVVSYTNGANNGTLTLFSAGTALGVATITVTLNNGAAMNTVVTQSFTVTVLAPPVIAPAPTPISTGGPTLGPIANLTLVQGATLETVDLNGITPGALASKLPLHITTASSNPRLAPAPMVRYTSPSSNGLLTLRLVPANTGMATITVTANNGAKSNNIVRQSFTVTVVPPAAPTLDPIANLTVPENSGQETIQLAGITAGTNNFDGLLRVTASSSNVRAIAPRIQYASPTNTALLTFNPASHFTGTATVTVTVNDGNKYNGIVRQRFTVTVVPVATNSAVAVAQADAVGQSVPVENAAATLTLVAGTAGGFAFQVTGISGGTYVVQAATDLIHWTAVQTNTAPFVFEDSTGGLEKQFYRAYYVKPQ